MPNPTRRLLLRGGTAAFASLCLPHASRADVSGVPEARIQRLVAGYPDHLAAVDKDRLIWRDGTTMPLDDGIQGKTFEQMLRNASIADQLRQPYPRGRVTTAPSFEMSPGRIRNEAFFAKMYGDCRRNEVMPHMRGVTWMPHSKPQKLQITTVNDVAGRMEKVVAELERLPDALKAYLVPSAGTYNCRVVADTGKPSMHASGAAIDINVKQSDYWVWARKKGSQTVPYRNRIPWEIVEIFEAANFIWGGKWYHYDTMHFEYRPEMFDS